MKTLLQWLRERSGRMFRKAADRQPTPGTEPVARTGWPSLSTTSLARRRSTDAQPWSPDGAPDDWKR